MRAVRMIWVAAAIVAASGLAMFSTTASAGQIVSLGGGLVQVPRPAVINYNGTFFSGLINPNPIIFEEVSNAVIPIFSALPPSDPSLVRYNVTPSQLVGEDYLNADIMVPGTYPPGGYSVGRIISGTSVDAFIVNFEPSDSFGDTIHFFSASGSVTFDSDVLGIQTSSTGYYRNYIFDPSIDLFGSTGLEFDIHPDPSVGSDELTLSADRRTVSFNLNLAGATDDFRIFVTPTLVPEPATLALFGSGLAGAIAMRRRKKKTA